MLPDPTSRHCEDHQCVVPRDESTCCAPFAQCDSDLALCSDGQLKDEADTLTCSSWQCGSNDKPTCCRAVCNTLTDDGCPSGKLALLPTTMYCQGDPCSLVDQDTCCAPFATCDSNATLCPKDTLKGDAGTLRCSTSQCGSVDVDQCCDVPGTGDQFVASSQRISSSIICLVLMAAVTHNGCGQGHALGDKRNNGQWRL